MNIVYFKKEINNEEVVAKVQKISINNHMLNKKK